MERFIVSARKYRPNSFRALIGQDNIAATLKNSILKGQLAHAYLFCGPRGVGKTTSARIFAKTINCLNPSSEMEACGECESCKSFTEGRSYSIHELDAASNNSVEDIRILTEKVRIPPQIGKYSVFIIDEVHMLSQSAFNAFLKTLEEPPAHAIFILATTEKHKIIPTILSRCQTYDFNRISIEDIVKNLTEIATLEKITIDNESMHLIAQKADGAMRDALTIFDQMVAFCGSEISYSDVVKNLNVLDYEYYFTLTNSFLAGDYVDPLLIFDEILSKGFNPLHFIGGLSNHFRDLLVSKESRTSNLLELSPKLREEYSAQASKCDNLFLYKALEISSFCEAGFKVANNQRLHTEFALIKISKITSAQNIEPTTPEKLANPSVKNVEQDKSNHTTIHKSSPTTLSIKDMISKAGTGTTERVKDEESKPQNEEITKDKVAHIWKLLVDFEKETPRLASALENNSHELIDQNTIEFRVSNESQKTWIEQKCLFRIESFLKKNLNNDSARLLIKVKEADSDQSNKLYMPDDKAKRLMEKSEELGQLKNDLGLDIK